MVYPWQVPISLYMVTEPTLVLIAVSAAATSDSRFQSLIWFHHNQAVRALNKALENGQGLEDSTIYTVRGLLQIAVSISTSSLKFRQCYRSCTIVSVRNI